MAALIIAEPFWYPRAAIMGVNVRVVDLLALFTVPAYFAMLPPRGQSTVRSTLLLLLGGALLAGVLTSFFAVCPSQSFKKLLPLAEKLWLTWYFMSAATEEDLPFLLTAAVFSVSFQALFGAFFQYVPGAGDVMMDGVVRISGLSWGYLSTHVLSVLALVLPLFLHRSETDRGLLAVSALFLVALVLTQVRTVWALTACSAAVSGLLCGIRRSLGRLAMLAGVSAGCLALLMWASSLAGGDGGDKWSKELVNRGATTGVIRLELWKSAFRIFEAHPLLGAGGGGFGRLYLDQQYSTPRLRLLAARYGLGDVIDAHSAFFTRLAEYGLAGTAAHFALLYFVLRLAAARYRFGEGPAASTALLCFAVLAVAAELISDQFGINYFWVGSGLVAARAYENA